MTEPKDVIAHAIARWRKPDQVAVRNNDRDTAGLILVELDRAGWMLVEKQPQKPNKPNKFVPRHLQGLKGADLAVGAALTPLFIPIWLVIWITSPIRWAYNEIMFRIWSGD